MTSSRRSAGRGHRWAAPLGKKKGNQPPRLVAVQKADGDQAGDRGAPSPNDEDRPDRLYGEPAGEYPDLPFNGRSRLFFLVQGISALREVCYTPFMAKKKIVKPQKS